MYKIISKRELAENVIEYRFNAPDIVNNARAGQFVVLIVDEFGERLPFTICGADKASGVLTLLVQTVGASTMKLAKLNEGDCVFALAGPLGEPTNLEQFGRTVLVCGGIGTAVIFPQAVYLDSIGKRADAIIGAREKRLLMYEQEFRQHCGQVFIATDDGSCGHKGFVTDVLRERILSGAGYEAVFAVGPMPMMRAVCAVTAEYGIKTIVSMNCLMVDGTGMCGGCRLTVGGQTKYACVDGPEFDGHLVDWQESLNRLRTHREFEQRHKCRLTGEIR